MDLEIEESSYRPINSSGVWVEALAATAAVPIFGWIGIVVRVPGILLIVLWFIRGSP